MSTVPTKVLDNLGRAIEDLVLSGLSGASAASRSKLQVAFQAAGRARLLRLASSLRVVIEELRRFDEDPDRFSAKRFSFFVNRSWLLVQGLLKAQAEGNEDLLRRLNHTARPTPVQTIDVVTMGVAKRAVPGAFVALEFRLRTVSKTEDIAAGSPMVWSAVFPTKSEIAPEAFLVLEQKQGFRPQIFTERKVVRIEGAAVVAGRPSRILLGPDSKVTAADPFKDWERLLTWSPADAATRLEAYLPGPLDLPNEHLEEVVLSDWSLGETRPAPDDRELQDLRAFNLEFDARFSTQATDKPIRTAIRAKTATQDRLYGLVHYEMCRFVLQPLTLFGVDGPSYASLSNDKHGVADLIRSLNLT